MLGLSRKIECKKSIIGYIVSFVVSALGMYLIFCNLGFTAGGKNTILFGDLRENYIPAIRNLCRDILNDESIYYAWNTALGMNTSLYNAYYAYNPFNILYLIFYNGNDSTVTVFLVILKTGLAAVAFNYYLLESHDVKSKWGIIFSVFYSLCAFQVSYNSTNIIWLDAMFILPLVFRFIEKLLKEGTFFGLFLCYTYVFITQFYMGYMIGIVSFIYFVLRCFNEGDLWKTKKHYIHLYGIAVIGAIGLSAWVWVPTVFFLLNNNPADATEFVPLDISAIDFFRAFFYREIAGVDAKVPNLYCGMITLVLTPVFFVSKKINYKKKIVYGAIVALMVASCFIKPLYEIWHGFDNPDGWTYRFAYIISFLLCSVAAVIADKADKKEICILLVSAFAEIVLYLLCYRTYNETYDKKALWGSIIWVFVWLIILIFDKFPEKRHNFIIIPLTLLGVIGEMTGSYYNQELLKSDTLESEYLLWNITQKEVTEQLKKDKDIFRVNYLYDLGLCSGTYFGYNGMAHYSTAENPNVRATMGKLGLANAPRVFLNFGLTPVTEMLFDVRYDVIGAVYRAGMKKEDTYAEVIKNEYPLSLGYMIYGDENEYEFEGKNAFDNNNFVLSKMTGNDIHVFSNIPKERINIQEEGVKLYKEDGRYIVEAIPPNQRKGNESLTYIVNSGSNVYGYIYHDISVLMNKGFILEGGYENSIQYCGNLSVSYIKSLVKGENGYLLRIIPVDNAWRQSFEDVFFAELNIAELTKAYNILQNEQMHIKEYDDDHIVASVNVTDDKDLLFTSIPYDKGWKVWINGVEGNVIPILNDTFSAVRLGGRGQYELEFRFKAIGAEAGLWISLVSLIGMVSYMLYFRKMNKVT